MLYSKINLHISVTNDPKVSLIICSTNFVVESDPEGWNHSRFVLRVFGVIQGIQNEIGFRRRGYTCVRVTILRVLILNEKTAGGVPAAFIEPLNQST
jgi:hypothetical protein